MEEEREQPQFTSAMELTQMGVPLVPQRYVLPTSQRPNPNIVGQPPTTILPIIDLSSLNQPSLRARIVDEIRIACKEIGFLQVINHGIPTSVMKDALDCAQEFFNLPIEEKISMVSDNVNEPVRYGTSVNHNKDEVHFWRDFIKHYSHPISNWIHLWPSNPPPYKEKMGKYAKAVQILQKQLMEVVLESLGLNPNYLQQETEKEDEENEESQVIAVNYYPACPQPELALGMPPHSDYGSLTILLQSCQGLQLLMDQQDDKSWLSAPIGEGGLIVQLGDQMEVISNGLYKSVVHRATVSSNNRLSIASLHSLAMEKKARPAPKLVDDEHPLGYGEFSFKDFLEFISDKDITKGMRFIDTLKKNPWEMNLNKVKGEYSTCM